MIDPREQYDLRTDRVEQELSPEEFTEISTAEPFQTGWVTTAVVVDDDGRVLLIRDENSVWLTPGGTRQPGESLADCVRRELREETGVRVEPLRPYAATEQVYTCREPERFTPISFTVVTYAARPETTELADPAELPEADDDIEEVAWVTELPEEMLRREDAAYVLSNAQLR